MAVSYNGATCPPIRMITKRYNVQLEKHTTSMTISRSMDQVSELVINIDDPGFALLSAVGEPLGARIETLGLAYIVDSMDIDAGGGQGGMTLNCRPATVRSLKARRGPLVMNRVSPTTWVQREVKAVGGKFFGQASSVRSRVARDVTNSNTGSGSSADKPSTWTTMKRLAEELGYLLYEDNNYYYFGKPSWLIKASGSIRIDMKHPTQSLRPLSLPTMSLSMDEPQNVEYSVVMGVEHAIDVRPGMRVDLVNFPLRNGSYLLTNIDHPIYGSSSNLNLTLKKPVDPEITKV